jgi:WD40 repeat protein
MRHGGLLLFGLLCAGATALHAETPTKDRYGDPLPVGAVARLGSTRWVCPGCIAHLAFSPDGKTLAAGAINGVRDEDTAYAVTLWDATTGRQRRRFGDGKLAVPWCAFLPDGKALVTAGDEGSACLWDVATGKQLRRFDAMQGKELCLALSADGKTLASARWGKRGAEPGCLIQLWDMASGKQVADLKGQEDCTYLEFSRDGKRLFSLGYYEKAHIWDVAARKELSAVPISLVGVSDVLLAPDGSTFLCWRRMEGRRSFDRGAIESWDVGTATKRTEVTASGGFGGRLTLSPDARLLVEAAGGTIIFRDAATGRPLRTADCGSHLANEVRALSFSPDGKLLACDDGDRRILLIDVATGKLLHREHGTRGEVRTALFSPDGKTIATAGDDSIVRLWTPDGRELHRLDGWNGLSPMLAFSPDGRRLALADEHFREDVLVWATGSGKLLHRLKGSEHGLANLAFSADGRALFAFERGGFGDNAGTRRGGRFWDSGTGKELQAPRLPGDRFCLLSLSVDGEYLAYWPDPDDARRVRVWDFVRGADVAAGLEIPKGWSSVALSPDGRTVAWAIGDEHERTGRRDGELRLYEVASGRERGRYPLDVGVGKLTFSLDGRSLAFLLGRSIRVWDMAGGKERGCFEGHTAHVACLKFAPDGKSLVSGSKDSTALVWDLRRLPPVKPPPAVTDAEPLWADLASEDAARAYRAALALAAAPERTVPLLEKRLASLPAVDLKPVPRLIADLDDDAFAVREQAETALARFGGWAEPSLRQARQETASEEVKRRLDRLLDRCSACPPPDLLRVIRALEVLEAVGTPEARRVVAGLSTDRHPRAVAREAQATLRRLDRRASP